MVIECKIMYAAPFDPQYFKSDLNRSTSGRSNALENWICAISPNL